MPTMRVTVLARRESSTPLRRLMVRGAASCTVPSARLTQPSARARVSDFVLMRPLT
ncbi:hypothetical protein [Nonomuraea helvata]|uniref:Uncharacterized protein n=1 Tax=Nonomuraea helvata TaxID=37484 RepID=A0ABV5S3W6_9ACTN